MKTIFLAALFSMPALAGTAVGRIASGTNNITTSYGTGAGSLIISGPSLRAEGVAVSNGTSSELVVACQMSASAPADSLIHFYVPASGAIALDNVKLGLIRYCYVHTVSGTASSGNVQMIVKGD